VIVGVSVNYDAAQARQSRNNLGFVKRKKSFDKLAVGRVADMAQVVSNPASAGQIPFQLALCRWMRKIEQRGVRLTKETAQALQQLRLMRLDIGKRGAGQERNKPHEALGTIRHTDVLEGSLAWSGTNARHSKVGRPARQVLQRPALHVNERRFPSGVHHLEDVGAAIAGGEMKIVVVLAGQSTRAGFQPKNIARELCCFRLGDGLGYTRFRQHGPNLIASWIW